VTERRAIKKYANRRLYDTKASKHVTLADIRKLIVSGVDIQILDDTSGEDITRALLLQIIVEQEQSDTPLLPELLLAQLIRFYGNPMQGMMGDYLQQSVGTFVAQQENIQSQMQNVLSNTPMDTMHELMKQNMSAWESMLVSSVASDANKKTK
jgi:polyhydroxyalkanoate synthesis repressor PhaR